MTPKHRMLIGLLIFLVLAAQHLQPTENTESQNLTPFQQMQHLIKSNFDNDPNAPKYGKVIKISNISLLYKKSNWIYDKQVDRLINEAVVSGIREAAYLNKRLKLYTTENSVEDTLYSPKQPTHLVELLIVWDRIEKMQRIKSIDKEILKPKGIDVLIGGFYTKHYETSKLCLTFFVIDKWVKGIRNEIIWYPYKELTISDPYTGVLLLRPDIKKGITRSVRQILNYLPEQQ